MIECNCPTGRDGRPLHVGSCPLLDLDPAPVGRTYRLVTAGLDPEFDAIGVCIQALAALEEPAARIRIAEYLLQRARAAL